MILQYSASAEGEWDGAATFTSQASPEKLSEPLWKHARRFCRDTERRRDVISDLHQVPFYCPFRNISCFRCKLRVLSNYCKRSSIVSLSLYWKKCRSSSGFKTQRDESVGCHTFIQQTAWIDLNTYKKLKTENIQCTVHMESFCWWIQHQTTCSLHPALYSLMLYVHLSGCDLNALLWINSAFVQIQSEVMCLRVWKHKLHVKDWCHALSFMSRTSSDLQTLLHSTLQIIGMNYFSYTNVFYHTVSPEHIKLSHLTILDFLNRWLDEETALHQKYFIQLLLQLSNFREKKGRGLRPQGQLNLVLSTPDSKRGVVLTPVDLQMD